MGKKPTREEFIEKCGLRHSNFYIYDKVEYVNADTDIIIICPNHGEFMQVAYLHSKGNGCSECIS